MSKSSVARLQRQDAHVSPHHRHFYTSSVMEYIVPEARAVAFEDWYKRLRQAAQYYSGFLRADLCTPLNCDDGVIKYYSIIHFASPGQLELWITSDRKSVV